MIKAIIFDIGGVIYTKEMKGFGGEVSFHDHMRNKLNLSIEQWFNAIEPEYSNSVIGKISEKQLLKKNASKLGISEEKLAKMWKETFKEIFHLNKELLTIVKKLRKNYKTAILSDQWPVSYRILVNKKVKENFDVLVFSLQVKTRKPGLKIYNITTKRLKVEPKECVFIDNRIFNLKPAKKLGMKTILFKNNKQLARDLKKLRVNV